MSPSPSALRRRRLLALAAALIATAAIWLLLFGDSETSDRRSPFDERVKLSATAERILGRMQPAEKVDQVLLLGIDGRSVSDQLAEELRNRSLGGILIGPGNWSGASAGKALISEIERLASAAGRVPPLIAAAQEGGQHRALSDLPPAERQLVIGDFADRDRSERWAQEAAAALADVGIDLNLAPIADVATLASPIADRSFSDDPEIAAAMTAAAVRGCSRVGIACAPAHFPGVGAASQDTDRGPATVSLDPATLRQRDLAAFEAAFDAGAPAVVVAHAFYAAYDPVTPASLSPEIIGGLLRGELDFDGVAITDDLSAAAVSSGYRPSRAAVLALEAGADMIMLSSPRDQRGVAAALVAAVSSERIAQERLDAAAGRVIELKLALGLLRG